MDGDKSAQLGASEGQGEESGEGEESGGDVSSEQETREELDIVEIDETPKEERMDCESILRCLGMWLSCDNKYYDPMATITYPKAVAHVTEVL